MTRVSVCVPTYNGERFIEKALRSILCQTNSDFELIISDDASTDDTLKIIKEIHDPRMQISVNSKRLGLVGNWNRCLELASGEYITIFHQDDLMRRGNLAAKINMLDENPGVGFVYSNIEIIDTDGIITGGHWLPQLQVNTIESGLACFERLALVGNFISCPTVMVRARCYKELGGYDPRLPFTCDMEMWMRIASRYDVGYLVAPLIANRVHASQETQRFNGRGQEIREVRRALDIAFAEFAPEGVSGALKRAAHRNLVAWAYRMGRWRLSQHQWRAALGYLWMGTETVLMALAGDNSPSATV